MGVIGAECSGDGCREARVLQGARQVEYRLVRCAHYVVLLVLLLAFLFLIRPKIYEDVFFDLVLFCFLFSAVVAAV